MFERCIIHLDLDAFFASVEELLDPSIVGLPIIVGGDPRGRGVVASASYAARAFGVHSAMPVAQALRLCPNAVVRHGHHSDYSAYSRRVMAILSEYTPLLEQISIDEAFLDVSGTTFLDPLMKPVERLLVRLLGIDPRREQVYDQLGIETICPTSVAAEMFLLAVAGNRAAAGDATP